MTTVWDADSTQDAVVDVVNETVGIRNVAWDAERGLLLNEENVKMRGACNHESFTGVGTVFVLK
jgi:beta-galactosidase/beta-glucuronidase